MKSTPLPHSNSNFSGISNLEKNFRHFRKSLFFAKKTFANFPYNFLLGINFRENDPKSQKSRNFLPANVSAFKVCGNTSSDPKKSEIMNFINGARKRHQLIWRSQRRMTMIRSICNSERKIKLIKNEILLLSKFSFPRLDRA